MCVTIICLLNVFYKEKVLDVNENLVEMHKGCSVLVHSPLFLWIIIVRKKIKQPKYSHFKLYISLEGVCFSKFFGHVSVFVAGLRCFVWALLKSISE